MNNDIALIANKSLGKKVINRKEAAQLLSVKGEEIYDLLYWANKIRYKYLGDKVSLCSILSAKQGSCSEDCTFCTQSDFYKTEITSFPLVGEEQISNTISQACEDGADSLGLVTSGYSLNSLARSSDLQGCENDFEKFCGLVEKSSRSSGIPLHASIGCLSEDMAVRLANSGIKQVNHNLETSRNHFSKICTTHSYDDRLATLNNAKKAGLKVCSGGIFGIGESKDDVIDLAFTLREVDVDTVPLNFLNHIPGTPLADNPSLKPMEVLKTIAFFRFMLPDKEIKVAGGREANLRDLQSWMFYAGASSTMIGNYLTTTGRPASDDRKMIEDLGLVCVTN